MKKQKKKARSTKKARVKQCDYNCVECDDRKTCVEPHLDTDAKKS